MSEERGSFCSGAATVDHARPCPPPSATPVPAVGLAVPAPPPTRPDPTRRAGTMEGTPAAVGAGAVRPGTVTRLIDGRPRAGKQGRVAAV